MEISQINNLVELFYKRFCEIKNKDQTFLKWLYNSKEYSWNKVFQSIKNLSEEISKHIQKGDRCLLISENRPEWLISDLSIMLSYGITVPAYTTYSERDYEYIINDCKPSLVIVSSIEQYKKIKNILKDKDFIKKIIHFDELNSEESNLLISYKKVIDIDSDNKKEFQISLKRKDPASIIYTSGTQGNPKGVILSHGGILNNCEGAIEILDPLIKKNQTRFLTWLPLSHSYEHTVQFVQITVSARVFYAENIEKLIKNMNDCSPEIMTAVPRFYQNLFQKINANFSKAKGLKKKIKKNTKNI